MILKLSRQSLISIDNVVNTIQPPNKNRMNKMITRREYKVLKAIRDVNGAETTSLNGSQNTPLKSSKDKILQLTSQQKLESYEVNVALLSLEQAGFIADIFSEERGPSYNAKITDEGLCLLKNYKRECLKAIADKALRFIVEIILILATIFLTKYFNG